ncbi:TolC family protein [Chitinophaga sp. 30R24]|uniref:TolC family protein n=1 Tax=Chitinophaga sp. 30R24 TaxID=3248838 RepID=UPI003B91409F
MKQYKYFSKRLLTGLMILVTLSAGNRVAAQDAATLTLEKALEKALKNNNSLQVDALGVAKAQAQTALSKSALLPDIRLNSGIYHYFQQPLFFGFGDAAAASNKVDYGRFGGKDQADATLQVSMPIYNPVARTATAQSKLEEGRSRWQYKMKSADVAAAVRQVYLRILVLEKRGQLQIETMDRNKRALMDAKYLYAQGKVLLVDTLRAYTTWKNLEPELLRINNAIMVSKEQLNILMGDDAAGSITLSDTLHSPATAPDAAENNLYELAIQQRPEIRLLTLEKEMSAKEVESARNAKLPVISGFGQYQLQTQTNGFRYNSAYFPSTVMAGVKMSIPIYAGGGHNAAIKKAQIAQQQAGLRLVDATNQLHQQVKQIIANLQETSHRIQIRQTVTSTAESSYNITKYRYQRGAATRLELADAELALTVARADYLEAIFDYETAKIDMDRLLGITQ